MTMATAERNLGDSIDSWEALFALREREIHVVGAGSVEGAHLLLFLLDHGFTRLVGHDFNTADAITHIVFCMRGILQREPSWRLRCLFTCLDEYIYSLI